MTEKFGTFKGSANLTEEEKDAFDDLMRETIKKNSESLELASGLEFSTIEQLQQGASTLKSVVLNTVPGEAIGTMLDMEGRESAVVMMEKMANSFKNVDVPDPNKITGFIESVSASMVGVFEGLNKILFANDPSELPITDFENAGSLPYDTDIPGRKSMKMCPCYIEVNLKLLILFFPFS